MNLTYHSVLKYKYEQELAAVEDEEPTPVLAVNYDFWKWLAQFAAMLFFIYSGIVLYIFITDFDKCTDFENRKKQELELIFGEAQSAVTRSKSSQQDSNSQRPSSQNSSSGSEEESSEESDATGSENPSDPSDEDMSESNSVDEKRQVKSSKKN